MRDPGSGGGISRRGLIFLPDPEARCCSLGNFCSLVEAQLCPPACRRPVLPSRAPLLGEDRGSRGIYGWCDPPPSFLPSSLGKVRGGGLTSSHIPGGSLWAAAMRGRALLLWGPPRSLLAWFDGPGEADSTRAAPSPRMGAGPVPPFPPWAQLFGGDPSADRREGGGRAEAAAVWVLREPKGTRGIHSKNGSSKSPALLPGVQGRVERGTPAGRGRSVPCTPAPCACIQESPTERPPCSRRGCETWWRRRLRGEKSPPTPCTQIAEVVSSCGEGLGGGDDHPTRGPLSERALSPGLGSRTGKTYISRVSRGSPRGLRKMVMDSVWGGGHPAARMHHPAHF